jgi:predicted small secreted protein
MIKRNLQLIIVFMMISNILSACNTYQLKHSDIGVTGIRKIDQYDNGRYVKTFYEKQDPETGAWFEAERADGGNWRFTTKGKADKRDHKEFLRRGFPSLQ